MKQSNTVALPGLGQPLAFPYRVGRVAPCEPHLATPQTTAGVQRRALTMDGSVLPSQRLGTPNRHTLWRMDLCFSYGFG